MKPITPATAAPATVLLATLLLATLLLACASPTPPAPYDFATPERFHYLADTLRLDSATYAERFAKALAGSAYGDAMGAGTEMWDRGEIALRHGYVTTVLPSVRPRSPEGPWVNNGPGGTTTDDTRWKQLMVDYLDGAGGDPTPEKFAAFLSDYYEGQVAMLGALDAGEDPDVMDARLQQVDWIKEWARVAMAYRAGDIERFERARARFYGGEMSCAGMLYTPVLGLVAPTPDSAYALAYRHTLFDHGYAKDISSLVAAMTNAALRTSDIDSVLDVATYVDPLGYADARLVGRIPFQLAQSARRTVQVAREMAVADTLTVAEGGRLRVPRGYPLSREEWVRQDFVYRQLTKDQRAVAFHAGEIWQVLVAGLAWGAGDFDRTMAFIVNYGRDNDTVAAVAGTVLGASGKSAKVGK